MSVIMLIANFHSGSSIQWRCSTAQRSKQTSIVRRCIPAS